MFFRLFALYAVLAVAFANPKPEPQVAVVAPGVAPLAYTGYTAGYGAVPLAYSAGYSAYPYGYSGYYVR